MSPSATPATQSDGRYHQVRATPATQSAAATTAANGNQARHQSQIATPATQSDGRCHQVPGLPRKVTVDVTKCVRCLPRKVTAMSPSATPATQSAAATKAANGNQARHRSQPSAISATPATQSRGRCHQVPCLPRKVTVDVTKCHACHAKCRDHGGKTGTKRVTRASPVPYVLRLPRRVRSMSRSTTPATQSCV